MRSVRIILGLLLIGIGGGILGTWFTTQWVFLPRLDQLSLKVDRLTSGANKNLAVDIVPVERRPITPTYPPAFLSRHLSPVLSLLKRGGSDDREMGSALAVSSDGWLVTTAGVFGSMRVMDLGVMWNGRVYPIVQAVRDSATDVIFLKIDARELPVTTFVHAQDVVPGMAVWIEPRSKYLYPEVMVSVEGGRRNQVWPSERAVRRFIVSGSPDQGIMGGAVWDSGGHLVGLLDTKTSAGWSVLPGSDLSGALTSLLSTQEIRHASLGVRISSVSHVVSVVPRGPSTNLLQEGDVIERIERDILDGTADVGEYLLDYSAGAKVTVEGQRKGEAFQATITLGSVVTSEKLK